MVLLPDLSGDDCRQESQAKMLAVADAAMYEDKRFQRAGRGDVSSRPGVRECGAGVLVAKSA
jgi:hypothetical protein